MEKRINIEEVNPAAWKAMYNLSAVVNKTSLSPIQKHLISMRTSQINNCAYCINMHSQEALQSGETQQRLFLLSAWKETDLFTAEEQALLALTEEVTLISAHGVTDATYSQAAKFFSEETLGDIIMSIVLMNAWNRIALSTNLPLDA